MSASRFRPPPWRLPAVTCLCAAVLFGVVTPSPAGSLAPGASIANDGGNPGTNPAVGGGVALADTTFVPYAMSGSGSGTVREIVIRGDTSNPFGPTALTFLYQAVVKDGDVKSITLSRFGGFQLNVSAVDGTLQNTNRPGDGWFASNSSGYLAGGTPISRSGGTGINVEFDFTTANIAPPDSHTVVLIIRTNAVAFKPGNIALQDDGNVNVPGYAPTPEPGSLTLLGIGLAGMGGYGWRRRRQRTCKEEKTTLPVS